MVAKISKVAINDNAQSPPRVVGHPVNAAWPVTVQALREPLSR